jgi:endonuclease/exonuclease/phosphatase family metal-dependent hydrolase
VLTLNVAHGYIVEQDLGRIAAMIRESGADVVGLQQVDEGTKRTGGQRQTTAIATLAALPHAYFGAAFDYDGGKFGVAILSRFPLESPRVIRLDTRTAYVPGKEPHVAAAAKVVTPGGTVPFVTVDASPVASERTGNASALAGAVGADLDRSIVTGFFAESPGGELGRTLTGAGMVDAFAERSPSASGFTAPSPAPTARTSFVLRGKAIAATEESAVVDVQVAAHRPVTALFTVP